ncbi:phenylacetate-coenzyme A ligase [Acetivibrio straminisolvens JCM 21531]|uniref:Phenylacetate-coenzyme A ligase n=1 Tax=Acetivibrio straminisolvens JCM 21531 TaxID=1294263 RepID=W4V0X5_9FIRM|nr:phenylacetate-coenzyme A ligase [Acetivibrio straminisolvens JCM 21531]
MRYVYNNSPFYKKLLEPYKDNFSNYNIFNFQELPFTTKDDLRNEDLDMLSQPINRNAYFYETTGTTGKATPCPRNMIDVISSNVTISMAYKDLFQSVFGDEKPVVGIFGPTELHSFGDTLTNVCDNLGFCSVKAWPYSPVVGFPKTLEVMKKLKINALMCTPGLSMTLFKAAQKYGYDIEKDFDVRMLMVTGEMCTEPMVRNIESIWGAKVFNFLYGSQEALVISVCDRNNRMHIFPHNYIYEVVDPVTGEFRGFTGEGELVVTMLNPGGKPLIRYRTGDMVRIYEPEGDSPIPSNVIEIIGRVKDRIEINGRNYAASEFEETIMANINKCLGYQIFIDNVDGVDEIEIKIEMLTKNDESEESAVNIEQMFKNKLGIKAKVAYSDELSPVIYTGALVSWKAARIVDRRKKSEGDMEKDSAQRIIENKVIRTE